MKVRKTGRMMIGKIYQDKQNRRYVFILKRYWDFFNKGDMVLLHKVEILDNKIHILPEKKDNNVLSDIDLSEDDKNDTNSDENARNPS